MVMCVEVGIQNLIISEASRKAKGAMAEAIIARDMVYEAFIRKSPPINLSNNLLILKRK